GSAPLLESSIACAEAIADADLGYDKLQRFGSILDPARQLTFIDLQVLRIGRFDKLHHTPFAVPRSWMGPDNRRSSWYGSVQKVLTEPDWRGRGTDYRWPRARAPYCSIVTRPHMHVYPDGLANSENVNRRY